MVYKIFFAALGIPTTGLTPVFLSFEDLAGDPVAPEPAITEIGNGWYSFTYSPAEDIVFVIDGGSTLDDSERYLANVITPEDDYLDTPITTRSVFEGTTVALLVSAVWDKSLTALTHNIPTSAGRRLRNISSMIITDGTSPGGVLENNEIKLNGDAFSSDGAYDPAGIVITSGTGEGQVRNILEYDGATKIATVDRNWKINPADDSEYAVFANSGREHVNEGRAQAGGASTITLNVLASDSDDAYVGQRIFIRSGTGEDQAREIMAYDGTTKIATVQRPWDIVPDATTAYVMLPTGLLSTASLVSAIWNKLTSALTTVGSIGKLIVDFLDVAVSTRATSTDITGAVATGVIQGNFPVTDGGRQRVSRGDVATLTLNTGSAWDFTGRRVFFSMKLDKHDDAGNSSLKVNREATIVQVSPGIATFTFTVLESDTVGNYDAEFESRDADGVSDPRTVTKDFTVIIYEDVRK